MRTFKTLDAFQRYLTTLAAKVEVAERRGLGAAGVMLEASAKAMIGEEVREWPDLAASTVAQKQARGQTGRVSDTDPLYATGKLRTSIGHAVEEHEVIVGSTDPIAPLLEHGTSRMPMRPFIGSTMFREGRRAADLVANHMMGAVAGKSEPLKPVLTPQEEGNGG